MNDSSEGVILLAKLSAGEAHATYHPNCTHRAAIAIVFADG
tara:strand:- start:58 stop:180 length:123 start_codon:yes stop_codon:yes gene_type:complete